MRPFLLLPAGVGLALAAGFVVGRFTAPRPPVSAETPAKEKLATPKPLLPVGSVAARLPYASPHRPKAIAAPAPVASTPLDRSQSLEREGYAFESENAAAFARRAEALPPVEREAFFRGFFGRFSRAELAEALEFVAALPRRDDCDAALLALTRTTLNRTDAQLFASASSGPDARPASLLAGALATRSPDDALLAATIANTFVTGRERSRLLGASAATLVAEDPAAAEQLGADLRGEDAGVFGAALAAGWARRDPAAAHAWAQALPAGDVRSAALASIASQEAGRDVPAALRQLGALPAGDPARTEPVRRIAAEWAEKDTAAAERWAATLPDDRERAAAQAGIAEVSPVGIGAMLSSDEYGYPRVSGVIPNGAAARAGALQSGDRIARVQTPSGAWVDTRDMPLAEVISLVRGSPGTMASLEVLSAAGETRTVQLARERITHAPRPVVR